MIAYDGAISGAGAVQKSGNNALVLTGANTYTGGTIVSNGTLQIGNGTNLGSLVGDVQLLNSAVLTIGNHGVTTTLAGVISGTGRLVNNSTNGILILTGDNTYTNDTTNSAGTLQIGNGGTTGSIVGNVLNAATIAFNRSDNVTFGGIISSLGSVRKLAANTLTVTGANTYTGTTTISGGTLSLTGNGSLASSSQVQVDPGATFNVTGLTGGSNHDGTQFALAAGQTLRGTGTMNGGVTVRDGSTLAAGGSPGTLSVTGPVKFDPGSTLGLQLNGSTDTDAHRSRLALTGSMTFSGTVANPFVVDITNFGAFTGLVPSTYTVVNAGTIGSTGLNTPLSVTLGAGGAGSVTNTSNVRLDVSGFVSGNQFVMQQVGDSLQLSFHPGPAGGDFNLDGLLNCQDVDALVADIAAGLNTAAFDVSRDGLTNGADLTAWLSVAGFVNLPSHNSYLPGDANLDGNVDGSDFIIWNSHKFTSIAAWCSGDVNADGAVDGSDFIIWNSHKFTSSDAVISAVPEPGCLVPLLLCGLLVVLNRSPCQTFCGRLT